MVVVVHPLLERPKNELKIMCATRVIYNVLIINIVNRLNGNTPLIQY